MTYESRKLESAYFSWESEEVNNSYYLSAPEATQISSYEWEELPDHMRIVETYQCEADGSGVSLLQGVSETSEQLGEWAGMFHACPSLELFQERIWDRSEDWGFTDEEVNDFAVWCAVKWLKYSYKKVADFYDLTKGQVIGIVQRYDRRSDTPEGDIDVQRAALAVFNHA